MPSDSDVIVFQTLALVNALKSVTFLGDASNRVESHGGTTNAAPDRST